MTPDTIKDIALGVGLCICAVLWCFVATQDNARRNENDRRDNEIKQMENTNA